MSWLADARHAFRVLAKTPAVTATAALTLAVAIGTNTALFSIVDAAMFRPFPYADPERIAWIDHTIPIQGLEGIPVSYPTVADWSRRARSHARMVAFRYAGFAVTGDSDPQRVLGVRVGAGLFELLGVAPALGRGFAPNDDRPGAADVAVISHGLWQRRFGGIRAVLGEPIGLDGVAHTIIGVMPPVFQFPELADVWVPLRVDESSASRGDRFYRLIARIRPGTTLAAARDELSAIAAELERTYPGDYAGLGVRVIPLRQFYIDDERPALLLALAAATLVLLIACSTVAGLLLSRGVARERELAMRAALGASRARLARQVLVESAMLALLSVGPGLLIAHYAVARVSALIPIRLPFWMAFEVDGRALAFTAAICVVAAVGFGSAPLAAAWKPDLYSALRQAGATGAGRRASAVRSVLVAAEVALGVVVLAGASLLLRTLLALESVDTGFRATNVLTVQLDLPLRGYRDGLRQAAFFQDVVDRVGKVPGADAAAVTSALPLRRGFAMRTFTIAGRPATDASEPVAAHRAVGPGYFQAMGIPLVAGRFPESWDGADSAAVVVISRSMAERFWPSGSPLGEQVKLAATQESARWLTVVGVVGDVRQAWFGPELRTVVYVPFAQAPLPSATLVVRSRNVSEGLTAELRQIVRGIDSSVPVGEVMSMKQVVDESFWQNRLYAIIFGACAVVALVLAAGGVFAVVSYSVALRAREWSIRAALGATRGDVLRAAASRGMMPALIGAGLGAALAVPATSVMTSVLFGVPPWDPVALTAAPLMLTAAALAASILPARRAARADPATALRC